MKNIAITFTLLFCVYSVNAQQEAMYTHYAFNTLSVNPAYAGSRDALTMTALHRSQWVGFKGAPTTQTFTMHAPLRDNSMGLGFSALNDKIGPVNNSSFYLDYAYKIPLGNGKLSMALKGGLDIMQASLTPLLAIDNGDAAIGNNIRNEMLPNFGLGTYYSTDNYYLGLSCPRLIQNHINLTNLTSSTAIQRRHYYFIAGTMIDINSNLQVKPMGLIKLTRAAPTELDLTAIFVLDKKIELGGMYRTGDAVGVLFGINFDNNLRLGYSFDWSFGVKTGKYNAGSHEIVLRYDFVKNVKRRIVSPRYF
jgi:type IX secretion system PorP/SprF family membrane protein